VKGGDITAYHLSITSHNKGLQRGKYHLNKGDYFHQMCIQHHDNDDNKINAYMETTLQGGKQLPIHSQDYIKSKQCSRNLQSNQQGQWIHLLCVRRC